VTLFLTSPPTETQREQAAARNRRGTPLSTSTDSARHQSATAETDYFSAHLRDAVPLDRQAEYALTSRIERLSTLRAEAILGFPPVIAEVLSRVRHHVDSKNESGAILRRGGAYERLLAVVQHVESDLRALSLGDLSPAACNDRLDSKATSLLSDPVLQSTRILGATAIERYRHLVSGKESNRSHNSDQHRGCPSLRALLDTRLNQLQSIEAELNPNLERFVQANLRLVLAVASRFHAHGELREELIAAGNYSLTRCARDFKSSIGVRFSTYAFKSIEHAMIEILAERGRRTRTVSLSHPLSATDDSRELIHTIADPTCVDPHEAVAATDYTTRSKSVLARALLTIPLDERSIIERSFGLNGFNSQSIRTIAAELEQSAEYVRTRLERGKMRLHRTISMMDEWLTLDPRNDADSSFSEEHHAHSQPPPAESRTVEQTVHRGMLIAAPAVDRAAATESVRMPPTPELFALTERYTAALTRIRRSVDQDLCDPALRQRCLDHIRQFHEYLTGIWPVGHSEHRYGFQLEGEMLHLKKNISAAHLEAITAAIADYRTGVGELRGGR